MVTTYTFSLTAYAFSSGGGLCFFDDIFLINSNTIPISTAPCITNLSPITKVAGIGDVLTIEGYNFGNSNGTVLFTTADEGGTLF